jgi:hypothetical protein
VPRFVLRYRGKGTYPSATPEKLRGLGASIVEATSRMLLVEAEEAGLRELLASDRDWVMAPEVSYAHPDPRRSIK